jgi:hypothetical protein
MSKTIILPTVTIHVKDEKRSKPFKFDAFGALVSGKHVVIEVPPGTAVEFEDEAEADRILARHLGEVTTAAAAITVKAAPDEVDDDEVIPLAATKGKPAKPADA